MQLFVVANFQPSKHKIKLHMKKSVFLFVPYPSCKSNPNNEYGIRNMFGQSNMEAAQNSAKTKSNQADEVAFQNYLAALCEFRGQCLNLQWTNPFRNSQILNLGSVDAEMLHTIWNFISFLQERLLEQDCGTQDGMQIAKYILSDLSALIESFGEIVINERHPVFTSQMYEFMLQYHHYICSLFLFYGLQNMKQIKIDQICKAANTSLIELQKCERGARELPQESRAFFIPVIENLVKYFNGYICLNMGKKAIGADNYREGLAFYQKGNYILSNVQPSNFATIDASVSLMKNAISSTFTLANAENKKFWNVATIPDAPEYPVAYRLDMDKFLPTFSLRLQNGFKEDMAAIEQSLMEAPDIPGISTNHSTPSSNSSNNPPKFTPNNNGHSDAGPPAWKPTPNSNNNNNQSSGGPPVWTPSPNSNNNNNNQSSGGPPVWTPPQNNNNNNNNNQSSGGPPVWRPPQNNNNNNNNQSSGGPPVWRPPQSNNATGNQQNWRLPQNNNMPASTGNQQSWSPPQNNSSQFAPPNNNQQNDFPNWNNVVSLKRNILSRLQLLKQRCPNMLQVLNAYEQQFHQASSNDNIIEKTINDFRNGQNIQKQSIDGMINQASGFYNQLNSRLDQIEHQY